MAPDSQVEIIYEDNHLLALVKPAGILTQGDATGDAPIVELAKAYVKGKYAKPGDVFMGIVQRLDRPTSGVLLFARTSKAAERLCKQFRDRTTEKIYLAITEGIPAEAEGIWTDSLLADKERRKTRRVESGRARAREARLSYRVLHTEHNRALVRIRLLTGIKHQIRVQFASRGLPLVGDFKYDSRQGVEPEPLFDGRAVALHAASLTVDHPTRHTPIIMIAPLPAYWPDCFRLQE